MIPNNINNETNVSFFDSVQQESHSSSWRLTRKLHATVSPSDFYHCFLSKIFYTKMVFSPLLILIFLCLRRQTWPYDKIHEACAPYCRQQANVQSPVCAETVTCAFCCYQQQSCCPKDRSGCNLSPYSIQLQVPFYWRLFLHMQSEDARCRGERNPLSMA